MIKDFSHLKVAIVHDWIYKIAGAEKCAETLCEIFPDADLYALFGDKKRISSDSPIIADRKITFSVINKLPFIKKYYRYTYFLWPMLIESFDLRGYDLVISTSSCVSKGVVTGINTKHICYMFTPMRYAWDQSKDYFNPKNFSWWKRLIIPPFLHFIRIWDVASTHRIDFLITISTFVRKRIFKYYKREVDKIIFPPVYVDKADYSQKKEDYYFAIAPFEPNKGGRLMIEAAIKYGFKLKIIGTGSLEKELKKKAKDHENIEFLGWISEDMKWKLLSKAKGFLFTGIEDFGIAPLEAIASGTPVIAYKSGGALDYIKEGENGTFIMEQTSQALIDGIKKVDMYYREKRFNPKKMNEFVKERFSKGIFVKEFKEVIREMI